MGLDQYLYKKTYVKQWEHNGDDNFVVSVMKRGSPVKDIQPSRIAYIIEEVGYWRKANQIHKWFVDNVQSGEDDCGEYCVSREKLEELKEYCTSALKAMKEKNYELVEEILPTQPGFFFGSLEYDEYYEQDLKNTISIIHNCLIDEGDGSFYYSSSW